MTIIDNNQIKDDNIVDIWEFVREMIVKYREGKCTEKELAYFKLLIKEATNELKQLIKDMPERKETNEDWIDDDYHVHIGE
jgi:hypothetical protein